jgi:anthranilate/para-aminobenzoate synthase component I
MVLLRQSHAELLATEKEARETTIALKAQREDIERINEKVSWMCFDFHGVNRFVYMFI